MSQALWRKYDREEIIRILNDSKNISDLTRNLGYHTRNKSTRKQINLMLEFYNLELPFCEWSTPLQYPLIENRVCGICGQTFTITKRSQQTRRYCFECSPVTKSPRFKINAMKKKVVELRGGKCERCGYDKCIDAFEFHHLDQSKKEMSLSRGDGGGAPSFEKYLEEANKCILLCANCHREEHWRLRREEQKLDAKN